MRFRVSTSLRVTVPLILLGFAATLSAISLVYHVPRAERVAEEDVRKRMAQEMSRLQSTLEYLLLKGDVEAARHEIAVLAHNHDVRFAALADEQGRIVTATRLAWIGRAVADVLPASLPPAGSPPAARASSGMTVESGRAELVGRAALLIGGDSQALPPTRTGEVLLAYDLSRYRAEARTHVLQQSLYWSGCVAALALAMWIAFHFLLTRRTAWLVEAAERFAAGDLNVRSRLAGTDELARLSRAFDAMAREVADTQNRLRGDIAERARVQRALEDSEARLQQILDNATAVVYVKDTAGRLLFVNRQWERVFGVRQDDALGRNQEAVLPAGVANAYGLQDLAALRDDAAIECEESVPLPQGTRTYISVKFPLHDAAGTAYAVCNMSTDITARQQADEALRVSEASYRAIFDASEDAIFVHDPKTGAIVDVNEKACAAFGYTRTEFREMDVGALGTGERPYTQQDARGIIARAAAGEEVRIEWHGRRRSGELRWHDVFVRRVVIGGRERVLALARDITDRKSAEAALRASEEQYRSMFNASTDGVAMWNASGDMVDANPALRRMYGFDEREGDAVFAHRDGGPSYEQGFLRAVAAGKPLHIDVTDRRRDGTPLDLEVHGIPMQYQGKPHVLTIARDVTERKLAAGQLARQREALHQREKLAALGSLLAGVSHELNNPLSVVVARAVLLEERGDASTRTAAHKIRAAAERCSRIVRTFLAMARQQQPSRGPVSVNDVVAAALDITGYALRTSSIEVALDLAPDLPAIRADGDQLHQVLLNLIINAQQALRERAGERRITVRSRADPELGVVRVSVADNGPGIPPAVRARIFEPYFTTKDTGVGLGVGLAVSLGIVEAHGGSLAVDCPEQGGAVFTIELPLDRSPSQETRTDPPVAHVSNSRAILVVDDEPDIRDTLCDILGSRHRVTAVDSGREALKRMETQRYDAILTDIRMADGDGRWLYREIAQRWPDRAGCVVFVTGDTLATDLRQFVGESGRPVIEKPFLPEDVRRVIAQLFDDASLRAD